MFKTHTMRLFWVWLILLIGVLGNYADAGMLYTWDGGAGTTSWLET